MKIDITCYPSMDGSGIIVTELGIKMTERGHEVCFIASSILFRIRKPLPSITTHRVEVNQCAVFRCPPYDVTLNTEISEAIKGYDLDILYMHYTVPRAVCGILARQMSGKDIKIMTTLHGTNITVLDYDHSLKGAIKFGIEQSDLMTSVSHSSTKQTQSIIETDKEVIPICNFVRKKEFPTQHENQYKELYDIEPEEKILTHVSNFRKVKRIDTILEAFAKVHKHIPSKLILLDDGPKLLGMRKVVRSLHIKDDALLLGEQDQVSKFYQMVDLALLLSGKESFDLTLLEAMATGIVPIGSNAGGIEEVIKHGEAGYIVDIGDSRQASRYALKLLTDERLYQKLQSNVLKDTKQRFSSELIVNQYEYYYRKMLN